MAETAQERKRYSLVLAETENLSREQWLDYRRKGIGGSDVAAIMGISPFRTARDIYYDKLNIETVEGPYLSTNACTVPFNSAQAFLLFAISIGCANEKMSKKKSFCILVQKTCTQNKFML